MDKILDSLLALLNQISVRGEEDCARMHACIRTVKQLQAAFQRNDHNERSDLHCPTSAPPTSTASTSTDAPSKPTSTAP